MGCGCEWTSEKIVALFQSSGAAQRGFFTEYQELAAHLNAGYVLAKAFSFTSSPEDPGAECRLAFDGGSSSLHGLAKLWAYSFLCQQGEPAPVYEYTISEYGRADVVSRSLRLVVEVGDTPPRKVIDALLPGYWQRFILIPFPDSIEALSEGSLIQAVGFTLSPGGRVELQRQRDRALFRNNAAAQVGL